MYIIFLCGSLEQGKDGVGDYTRRLAGELIRQGHQCAIASFMDKHIEKLTLENQTSENIDIATLRLPFDAGYKHNLSVVKNWVKKQNPNWLSLQYVPFAFNNKGLPFFLGKELAKIGSNIKYHVMFHEMWVGMSDTATFKEQLWGKLQKLLIFDMIKSLKPSVVHTQSRLYQHLLNLNGLKVYMLPLFGNIPVVNYYIPEKTINIAVFGGIHFGGPIKNFLDYLIEYKEFFKPSIKIIFIGRNGAELNKWLKHCKEASIETEITGELTVENISQILQKCTVGISTTPLLLADKSGAVAAMREHGLPILDLGRNWKPRGVKKTIIPEFIVDYKNFMHLIYLKKSEVRQKNYGLVYTTELFLKDLILNTSNG